MKQESPVPDIAAIEKSLEGLSLEDKVTKLIKKLADSEASNEKLKGKASQADSLLKANTLLEKKLERVNHLLVRTEESKSKLEDLCRQLQKYNKDIREESIGKIRLLEAERQNAVDQLRTTLKDIENSMKEGKERSDRLADDNRKLAEKLQGLGQEYETRLAEIAKQYEVKDKYFEEYNATKDLEVKLLKAKLEAATCDSKKLNIEKEQLVTKLVEGSARVGDAVENEKVLREQVKLYAEKYSSLTESLTKSNAAFDKFKKEIDKVNSNMKKMENDAMKWKQKYDEASKNVLVLTMSKKELEDAAAVQAKKLTQLEQLCRALSARKEEEAPEQTAA